MSKGVQLKNNTGEKVYPRPFYAVGDLYLTTNTTNPNLLFGGVWELFGPGRCLVCVDTSQAEFNSVSKTGGAKTHTLTVEQIPNMRNYNALWRNQNYATGGGAWGYSADYGSLNDNNSSQAIKYGGGQAHNNLQPFITCYVWLRTA